MSATTARWSERKTPSSKRLASTANVERRMWPGVLDEEEGRCAWASRPAGSKERVRELPGFRTAGAAGTESGEVDHAVGLGRHRPGRRRRRACCLRFRRRERRGPRQASRPPPGVGNAQDEPGRWPLARLRADVVKSACSCRSWVAGTGRTGHDAVQHRVPSRATAGGPASRSASITRGSARSSTRAAGRNTGENSPRRLLPHRRGPARAAPPAGTERPLVVAHGHKAQLCAQLRTAHPPRLLAGHGPLRGVAHVEGDQAQRQRQW